MMARRRWGIGDVEQRLMGLIGRLGVMVHRLRADTRGVTAVEYGVICALIVVASIASIGFLGSSVFTNLYTAIANATSNAISR